jgi:DNA-formamidopyrimidine glycosylase
MLDGSTLLAAESAGKHLFLDFDADRVVHVHLGLIGGFDVHRGVAEVPPPVGQVRLRLVRDETAYADLRGATQCALVTGSRRDAIVAKLGPDPLRPDAEPALAWRRISRSPRAIGDLLMDQEVLAGVGNVYRAEVLFRHRIHPLRPGRTLRVGQWRALWADLVDLMAEGVRTGRIDTVRPEHTPEAMGRPPRTDDHGGEVYVYRRTGQPCLVCGSTVRTDVLVGRNIFWCPSCQRRFRSRALQ